MEKEMEQQEQTKEIRNNVNEREVEIEWLALRSGKLSVELQGTVCTPVLSPSILNKQTESLLKTISSHSLDFGCISINVALIDRQPIIFSLY